MGFSEDQDICKELDLPSALDYSYDLDLGYELSNAEFVHSMVCLKYAVESRKAVSVSNIHCLVKKLAHNYQVKHYKGKG